MFYIYTYTWWAHLNEVATCSSTELCSSKMYIVYIVSCVPMQFFVQHKVPAGMRMAEYPNNRKLFYSSHEDLSNDFTFWAKTMYMVVQEGIQICFTYKTSKTWYSITIYKNNTCTYVCVCVCIYNSKPIWGINSKYRILHAQTHAHMLSNVVVEQFNYGINFFFVDFNYRYLTYLPMCFPICSFQHNYIPHGNTLFIKCSCAN